MKRIKRLDRLDVHAQAGLHQEVERLARDRDDELAILDRNIYARLCGLIEGKTVAKGPKGVKSGAAIDAEMLDSMPRGAWWQ